MSNRQSTVAERRQLLGRRNLAVLGLAVITLVAGYLLLATGASSSAAVLLVIGYVVLFPLAIAL